MLEHNIVAVTFLLITNFKLYSNIIKDKQQRSSLDVLLTRVSLMLY